MSGSATRHPLLIACALSLGPSIGNGFGRFAYALILPAMKTDLAWTYTQAGWINTANAIGYLTGALLSLRLIARIGSASFFRWGMVSVVLALLASGATRDFALLLSLRVLAGVGAAAAFVAGSAMAAGLYKSDPRRNALAIALYFGGAGVGIALPGSLLPPLLEWSGTHGWPLAWLALGAIAAASLWLAFWASRHGEASEPARVSSHEPLPWSPLLPSLAAYLMFGVGYIAYMTFLIAWLRTQGLGVGSIVATWTALGLAVIVSPLVWRPVLARGRGGWPLGLSMLATGIGALAPALFGGTSNAIWSAIVFGVSFFIPSASITALSRRLLPHEMWGRAVALYTTVFAIGQIVGPIAAGWLADASGSLRSGLIASAGVLLLGGVLALLQRRSLVATGTEPARA